MHLIEKANDKEFWSQTVRNEKKFASLREKLLKTWENDCENKPIEVLKYTEFRMYGIDGNRNIFEKGYFHRRGCLETAAQLALIYPEEEKYLDYLQNTIFAICNEFTWTLPAHQPDLLTSTDNTFIDLFDCETGGTLAEIDAIFEDRLDPLIRNRIKLECKKRVVDPYLAVVDKPGSPWWRGGYTGNWVAVCCANIATTVFHLFPECYTEGMKRDYERLMNNFLSGFSENGFCDEGPGYWGYGFGFFVLYADLVYRFTGGEVDYFKLDKVRKISTYLQKVFLNGKTTVSFSDASRSAGYDLCLIHYLKERYPDDVEVLPPEYGNWGGKIFCFRSALWLNEELYNAPTAVDKSTEYYDSDYQWLIKKTPSFGFAAKAGHNAEHHNHNDIGSFIIAKKDHQIYTDMGAGVYTKQYGDPVLKYAHNEASSNHHSLPIFNDCYQREGRSFASSEVTYENGVFSMEFAAAYGLPEVVFSAKRAFTVTDDTVTVADSFDVAEGTVIVERFTLLEKPEIVGNKIITENSVAEFKEGISEVTVTDKKNSHNLTYYTVDFKLNPGVNEFVYVIK